jgi:hypothetical protein
LIRAVITALREDADARPLTPIGSSVIVELVLMGAIRPRLRAAC